MKFSKINLVAGLAMLVMVGCSSNRIDDDLVADEGIQAPQSELVETQSLESDEKLPGLEAEPVVREKRPRRAKKAKSFAKVKKAKRARKQF